MYVLVHVFSGRLDHRLSDKSPLSFNFFLTLRSFPALSGVREMEGCTACLNSLISLQGTFVGMSLIVMLGKFYSRSCRWYFYLVFVFQRIYLLREDRDEVNRLDYCE